MTRWRDTLPGELRAHDVGRRVTVSGWADTRRDHGGLVFIDLRDHSGKVQLVANPEHSSDAASTAHQVRNEFVLRAEGEVVPRAPEAVNPGLPTGEVEIKLDRLEIVNRSTPLPFQLDEEGVDETLRLRYRWLDMRRDRMQRNLRLNHVVISAIRHEMDELGFVDVWTPAMTRGTPEGARDFLVPVRLQPGRFFALAQSPQLFKQLCMIGGLDRYYQIATCFRDEDLRADRQFEFRQLDLEMGFVEREDVLDVLERSVVASFHAVGREPPPRPFPRLAYAEAMARYGSDKPDLRFGLEIHDATAVTRGSGFGVFAGAGTVRYLVAPRAFSRTELQRLEEIAKEWGAKGLAYLIWDEGGEARSPIAKFLSTHELDAVRPDEPGQTTLFAADERETVSRVLGALRLHLGRELGLVDAEAWRFLWITDFPMFEWHEDEGRWGAVHHPFTRPAPEWEERFDAEPAEAKAFAYDLVGNGNELGGGSFRMHEPDLQSRVFDLIGLGAEEQRRRFGFLLDALAMGAPPHGGIAFGIDRMMMVLAREPNLRDVIAFPKNQAGVDPMSGAPAELEDEQLRELGIRLRADPR
jgi:aspartyl-tRNA synthetase